MIKKINFQYDIGIKNSKIISLILKKNKNTNIKKADAIVILGGDGFMLYTLKKLRKYNLPFYGINLGTYGFLMNKLKVQDIIQHINKTRLVTINPLKMRAKTKNNKFKTNIAINEIYLFRQSRQTASLKILNKKRIIIKKLISDGVIVSTPAGSTAYNLSVHGPILSIDSKKLTITPISPFRPRRWRGNIVSDKSIINIKNLNITKRPISAVADNHEIRNIKEINISIDKKISFKLLYDKKNSLQKKIKIEQLRKETSNK